MRFDRKIRLQFAGVLLLALFCALIAYPKILFFWPKGEAFLVQPKINLGLDLQGGIHLEYKADTKDIPTAKVTDALSAATAVIERRVNAFGVGEPLVQQSRSGSEHRIIVELPGVKDIEQAKDMIKETPFLEFREVDPDAQGKIESVNQESQANAQKIFLEVEKGADFGELAKQWSQDPGSKDKDGDLGFVKKGTFVQEFDAAAFDANFPKGSVYPKVVESSIGWHILKKLDERPAGSASPSDAGGGDGDNREVDVAHIFFPKYSVEQFPSLQFKTTGLSGKNLTDAFVDYQSRGVGSPQIGLRFDDEGTKLFADITKRNIGKPVAIFLDQEVISQPIVQAEILNGQAVITGSFTLSEANSLVKRFNEGALPVPITLVGQQSVDASLGVSALHESIRAGIIGLIAVSLFMIFFYRFLGLIAVFALLLYSAMLVTLFKLSVFTPFPITLTLSGIAGFVLSIGIAVDANVLIFERTREELAYGKPVFKALPEGFRRAWPSIRDGHFSTLITTIILIGLGTGSVKGFAIILALGVLLSLFTAVVLVRITLDFLVGEWAEKRPWLLSSPKDVSDLPRN